MDQVKIIENFVTWQGEGPDSGRRVVLLRFKTCNLSCPFCDTAVKMRITAESSHRISDIQKELIDNAAGLMITGGEPTVLRHFDETVALLNQLCYPFANVETNGYQLLELIDQIDPNKKVKYIYSPKIETLKDFDECISIMKHVVVNPNIYFKIVVCEQNMSYLDKYLISMLMHVGINFTGLDIREQGRVWLMPEGSDAETLLKNSSKVFDLCEKYHVSFSSRNHIIFGFI